MARSIGDVEFGVRANTRQARSDISKFQSELQRGVYTITGSLTRAGNQLSVGLTAPILLAARAAAKAAIEVEKLGKQAGAIASLSLTGTLVDLEEFSTAFQQQARDIAAVNQFTSQQVGEAQVTLTRAGFSAATLTAENGRLVRDVGAFATAADIELNKAADTAAKVLGALSLTTEAERVENFERIADVLNVVASSAATNVTELGEATVYAGPLASQLGIEIEELGSALGILANAGFRSTLAGTGLRAIFKGLVAPAKKNQEILNELGINISDAEGNFVGLTNVLQQFAGSFQGLSDAEISSIAFQLFGQRGGPAFINLVNEANGQLVELEKRTQAAAGTTRQLEEAFLDTTAGRLEFLQGALESLAIRIFDAGLLEFLGEAADGLRRLIDVMATASPATMRIGVALVALTAAIGPVIRITGFFVDNFLVLARLFTFVGAQITAQIIAPLGVLASAFYLAYDNSVALKEALADTGQILASLFGGGDGTSFFSNIGSAIQAVMPQLEQFGRTFGDTLASVVTSINSRISGTDFSHLFSEFTDILPTVFGGVQRFAAAFIEIIGNIIDAAANLGREIGFKDLAAVGELLISALGGVVGVLVGLSRALEELSRIAGPVIGAIVGAITTLVGSLNTLGAGGQVAKAVLGGVLITSMLRFQAVANSLPRTAAIVNRSMGSIFNAFRGGGPGRIASVASSGGQGFFSYQPILREMQVGLERVNRNVQAFKFGNQTLIRSGNEFVSLTGRMRVAVQDFGRVNGEAVRRVGSVWLNARGDVVAAASGMSGAIAGMKTAISGFARSLASGLAFGVVITALTLGITQIVNDLTEGKRRYLEVLEETRTDVQNAFERLFEMDTAVRAGRAAEVLWEDFGTAFKEATRDRALEAEINFADLRAKLPTEGLDAIAEQIQKFISKRGYYQFQYTDALGFEQIAEFEGEAAGQAFIDRYNRAIESGDFALAEQILFGIGGETIAEFENAWRAQGEAIREQIGQIVAAGGSDIQNAFDRAGLIGVDLDELDILEVQRRLEQAFSNLDQIHLAAEVDPLFGALTTLDQYLNGTLSIVNLLQERLDRLFNPITTNLDAALAAQERQQNILAAQEQLRAEADAAAASGDPTFFEAFDPSQYFDEGFEIPIDFKVSEGAQSALSSLDAELETFKSGVVEVQEQVSAGDLGFRPAQARIRELTASFRENIAPIVSALPEEWQTALNSLPLEVRDLALDTVELEVALMEAPQNTVVMEALSELRAGEEISTVLEILHEGLPPAELERIDAAMRMLEERDREINIAVRTTYSEIGRPPSDLSSFDRISGPRAHGGLVNFGNYRVGETGSEFVIPNPLTNPVQHRRALAEARSMGFLDGAGGGNIESKQITYSPSYTINGVSPDQVMSRIRAQEETDMARIGGII